MEYDFRLNLTGNEEIIKRNGLSKKMAEAICNICDNKYWALLSNLKRRNRCVCLQCSSKSKSNYIDCKNRPLYSTWMLIKRRVDNTSNKKAGNDFHYDGINICEEWKSFPVFEKWALDNGWVKGLSIDRIDNFGDYEPSNCRIANHSLQMSNRKLLSRNPTGYIGIGLSGRKNYPYLMSLAFEKVIYCKKRFKTVKEALEVRNKLIIENNLPHPIQEYKGE